MIDQDLFDRCQEVRAAKAVHHEFYPKHRTYLLRDLVFCADCVENMPSDVQDDAYGKMRPHSSFRTAYTYYRCRARDFGRDCPQKSVRAEAIEEQVVDILKHLKPPEDWRKRIIGAMGQLLGDQKLEERIAEIKAVIARMDFRWDHGFITDQESYLEERVRLQQELERLAPMADDDLEKAVDVLEHFAEHWDATAGDRKKQQELIALIVARVWVRGEQVAAMSLRPDYHITMGLESTKPTEITVGSYENHILPRRERRASFAPMYKSILLPPLHVEWQRFFPRQ